MFFHIPFRRQTMALRPCCFRRVKEPQKMQQLVSSWNNSYICDYDTTCFFGDFNGYNWPNQKKSLKNLKKGPKFQGLKKEKHLFRDLYLQSLDSNMSASSDFLHRDGSMGIYSTCQRWSFLWFMWFWSWKNQSHRSSMSDWMPNWMANKTNAQWQHSGNLIECQNVHHQNKKHEGHGGSIEKSWSKIHVIKNFHFKMTWT